MLESLATFLALVWTQLVLLLLLLANLIAIICNRATVGAGDAGIVVAYNGVGICVTIAMVVMLFLV